MGAIPRFDGQTPGFPRGGDPAANLCEYLLRRHVDQCRRAAHCGAPNYARGDSDASRMCSLCGVGAHAPPGCLSKTGTKAMGVKAAARVVNGALTTMPPQQWQRWRCTRAQRRSLCLMQRRASRPRCPDCHWGARAAVCGKAQYRGPRCRGHGRLGERAGGLSGPQLHTRTVCVLTIAYLCPCGTPACPDAAARASARGVSRGTLF